MRSEAGAGVASAGRGGRTEGAGGLAELLKHQRLAQELGGLHVGLQPALGKGHVGAAPIIGPHVDAGVVDAVQVVVGQEVLARGQRPAIGVVDGVGAAQAWPGSAPPGVRTSGPGLLCVRLGHSHSTGQLGGLQNGSASRAATGAGGLGWVSSPAAARQGRAAPAVLQAGSRAWGPRQGRGALIALAVGGLHVALLAHSQQGAGQPLDVGGHVGDPALVVGSSAGGALAAALVHPARPHNLSSRCGHAKGVYRLNIRAEASRTWCQAALSARTGS